MKGKKGFTIVELLGVILILGIVLGLASLAFIKISESIKLSYYKSLEESVLLSAGDYFAYNKENQPKMFGDVSKANISDLVANKYITEVLDRDGNQCDGYVGAYKDSYDKTNYFVCLKCGDDYVSENNGCDGVVNYSLKITPTISDTTNIYQVGSWTNGFVTLIFKTYNDISSVQVEDESGSVIKSCNLTNNNGLYSCEIKITSSGNYKAYGVGESGNKTASQNLEIKIDNNKPSFNIYDWDNNLITTENLNYEYRPENKILVNNIKDIVDNESGIIKIKYSFEKQNEKEKFNEINNSNTNFEIEKEIEPGVYKLIVTVIDKALNETTKTIIYNIYSTLDKPTSEYCNDLTYSGLEQFLTRAPLNGFEFINNKGINVGSYQVIAKLKENYRWSDNTTDDVMFNCQIKGLPTAIIGSCLDLTYNGNAQKLASGGINITYYNNEGTNANNYEVTIKANSNYTFEDGSTTSVLNCTIKPKSIGSLDITLSQNSYTYDGTAKTPGVTVKDGSNTLTYETDYTVNYTNNINAGSAAVTITGNGNYTGTNNKTFTINKRDLKVIPTSGMSKTYGESDPVFTYNYENQVSGQIPKFTGSLSRETGESVGTYLITKGTLAFVNNGTFLISNYNLNIEENVNFTINSKSISSLTVTLDQDSYTYDGTAKTPVVTVKDGSNTLAKETDYKVDYKDNINAGTATITISGKGNYNETINKTFVINKRQITVTALDQTLTGQSIIDKSLSKISVNNLVSGHSVTDITLTQSTTDSTENGTITPSSAVIKSGTTTVTNNYDINYEKGNLTIYLTEYCANFYLNGASKIDEIAGNKTNVCCLVTSGSTCEITSPTITPATNYEVLGWATSSNATNITNEVGSEISLSSDTNFYAITRSSDDSIKKYTIEFNLNGADSYIIQGTTYTETNTFSCKTPYTYNGADLITTCSFTLPDITRSGGVVYGWDQDEENEGTPEYLVNQTIIVSSDIVLNAITSKKYTLSYDGNGGDTTLPNQEGIVYNDSEGAWVTIPSYDNENMCRASDSNYVGYKYIGLITSTTNTSADYCPGDKIYLTNDTKLYGLWNKVYATGTIKTNSGSNLIIRANADLNSSQVGKIAFGDDAYITGSITNKFYPVIYGSIKGYSWAEYITNIKAVENNSCNYEDFTCGGKNYILSITPSEVIMNIYNNELTKQLTIENQCGEIKSATSDNSKVSVTKDGLITVASDAVAIGETLTATLTFTTNGDCTDTVTVIVKNINETPPVVSVSISGETYGSGYKKGAVVTLSCTSEEGIASFTAKDNTGDTGTVVTDTTTTKTNKITLSTASSSRKVTVTCTSTNGLSASKTETYKIYVYSQDDSCGVSNYSYSGTCACAGGVTGTTTVAKYFDCSSTIYNYGSCKNYCIQSVGTIDGAGSCTRSTTYKTCWHY